MAKPAETQRRLLATRPIVRGQYVVNTKLLTEELFDKTNPLSIEDCLSGAVVLKLRQLADRVDAEVVAREADGAAGEQGREVDTSCGCRCNSAGGTRVRPKMKTSLTLVGRLHIVLGEEFLKECLSNSSNVPAVKEVGGVLVFDDLVVHGTVDTKPYDLGVPSGINKVSVVTHVDSPGDPDPSVIISALTKLNKRFANSDDVTENDCGTGLNPEPVDLKVALGHTAHVSSPVVAEQEADTSDAPAMTVQEGGGSDAAPGVESVPPAFSTLRFVAVGYHVYDRVLNRTAMFGGVAAAAHAGDLLNEGEPFDRYKWQEAL